MTDSEHLITSDFLVEIGTEELPPKALSSLQKAFVDSIRNEFERLSIAFVSPQSSLASPRRLSALFTEVADRQPDQYSQALGPAVSAAFDANGQPTGAALGFARKNAVAVDDLQQVETPKGLRLAHVSVVPGKSTSELLPDVIRKALAELPIPKRMRWGSSRVEFVRPLHWVLMLFGDQAVDCEIMGVATSNQTRGHRFHADTSITINRPSEYVDLLRTQGHVLVDIDERRQLIKQGVKHLAETELQGRAVISDELLDEVTALVEWPVPLAGKFDPGFLDVPAEALISSMKEHQKYFHVVDADGKLLPHFVTVANIESRAPDKVIQGNERVIRPRLADAAFFYNADLATPFAEFRARLKPVVFQAQLGSLYDKTDRVGRLAALIADLIGADAEDAQRAGELCKSDLVSQMVLEFGDLQGIMGRYYAQASDEKPEIASAMYEHYLPKFAGDRLPSQDLSAAVALADRIDTLSGIFAIGQVPSGSRDPFALRRASLGVLRILVESEYQLSLRSLIDQALQLHQNFESDREQIRQSLLTYMLDRFAAWFADMDIPAESFIAVRALDLDNPLDIYRRVLAVTEFGRGPNAPALAAANKRVANILTKSTLDSNPRVVIELFESEAETALHASIVEAGKQIQPLLNQSDFTGALAVLAGLRSQVDRFFDEVMVMVDDEQRKQNRLALLSELRALFLTIADISLLQSTDS